MKKFMVYTILASIGIGIAFLVGKIAAIYTGIDFALIVAIATGRILLLIVEDIYTDN